MPKTTAAAVDDLSDIDSEDDTGEEEQPQPTSPEAEPQTDTETEPETPPQAELPVQSPTDLNPDTWAAAVRPGVGDVQPDVQGDLLVGEGESSAAGPTDVTPDVQEEPKTSWQCLTNNVPSPNCPIFKSDSHLPPVPTPPQCPVCGSTNVLVVATA